MSEFMFGVGRGQISKVEKNRIAKAIKSLNLSDRVDFVAANIPGDGHKFWFYTRGYGHPFDGATAKAVRDIVGQIKTK